MTRFPFKEQCLLQKIQDCLSTGRYKDTWHASERQSQRGISILEIQQVLRSGYHEAKKDKFDKAYNAWNYAIRGKAIDRRDLRVIVSFDEKDMLIITAIELK